MKSIQWVRLLPAFVLSGLAAGCFHTSQRPSPDEAFSEMADEYLEAHLAWRPGLGTTLGLHQYDGRISDFSRASLDAELKRLKAFDVRLSEVNTGKLSYERVCDSRLLQTLVRGEVFSFEQMQAYSRNPMTYVQAIDLTQYVKRDFAPLPKRLRSVISIEMQLPALFTAARANLNPVLPKVFVETAIQIAEGHIAFLEKDLPGAVSNVRDESLQRDFQAANSQAVRELKSFIAWLREERLPGADNSYALGAQRSREMLRTTEHVDMDPPAILALGLRELKAEQERFAARAREIDPARPAVEVFRSIQKEHPTDNDLLPETRKNLEAIRQFVTGHNLVTIPSDVRVRVEETPPPFRRTSFASMDTPGVFETNASEAYYYVTPVETSWSEKQKEEWLTAFNYYTTDIVTIHEAYPGHYVQFLALKDSPASRIAKVVSSYAFVEGWAHYCEQMMLDEGFGAAAADAPPEKSRRVARYRLAQSAEALLRLCRLCLSIKLHTEGMTVEQATKFLMDNCYAEQQPAHDEAVRGTFDPGYLNYTLGKLMILKLRQDWQQQEGARYSLQAFHDEILRHGAPPLPMLRQRMIKDPAKCAEILW